MLYNSQPDTTCDLFGNPVQICRLSQPCGVLKWAESFLSLVRHRNYPPHLRANRSISSRVSNNDSDCLSISLHQAIIAGDLGFGLLASRLSSSRRQVRKGSWLSISWLTPSLSTAGDLKQHHIAIVTSVAAE